MPHRMRFRIQFKKFGVKSERSEKLKFSEILSFGSNETGLGEDD